MGIEDMFVGIGTHTSQEFKQPTISIKKIDSLELDEVRGVIVEIPSIGFVYLLSKGGQFGCPQSRDSMAFPSKTMSSAKSQEGWKAAGRLNNLLASLAILIGIVAVVIALRKNRKKG